MADEPGAGASYLASLKKSTTPSAAAAKPALAPNPTAPAASRPAAPQPPAAADSSRKDKRRSPRYRCQGSVRLREVTSGAASWATISDISMQGCYVEAASGYRAGAALALALEINGFRVETTAEVRVAYPGLGMGVSFTRISEADRERLRQLITSISASRVISSSPVATQSLSMTPLDAPPSVANPAAALHAMMKFFEDRHMMGREEFLRILRKNE